MSIDHYSSKKRKPPILVVGIDAALANLGLVKATVDPYSLEVLDIIALKLVSTEKMQENGVRVSADRMRRGREILQEMRVFCYGSRIAIAEVPEGSQSAAASMALGIATGLLCACPLPLVDVSPYDVKKASVGKATASKEEMRQWAYGKFPNAPWLNQKGRKTQANEHLADALAAVYAGVRTQLFKGYAGLYSAEELRAWPIGDEAESPGRRRLKR